MRPTTEHALQPTWARSGVGVCMCVYVCVCEWVLWEGWSHAPALTRVAVMPPLPAAGELLVVKKFHCPMSELSVKERLEIAQEVKLLAHLSHVNIIKFYDKCVPCGVGSWRCFTAGCTVLLCVRLLTRPDTPNPTAALSRTV